MGLSTTNEVGGSGVPVTGLTGTFLAVHLLTGSFYFTTGQGVRRSELIATRDLGADRLVDQVRLHFGRENGIAQIHRANLLLIQIIQR